MLVFMYCVAALFDGLHMFVAWQELYDVEILDNTAEETNGFQPVWPENCRGGGVWMSLSLCFGKKMQLHSSHPIYL